MKLPYVSLACILLLSTGCALVPSPYSRELNPIVRSYSAINAGMRRPAVEAQLGKPNREEEGACVWESQFDALNYATLKVWFGDDQAAMKVEVTRSHGKSVPAFHAHATSTWSK